LTGVDARNIAARSFSPVFSPRIAICASCCIQLGRNSHEKIAANGDRLATAMPLLRGREATGMAVGFIRWLQRVDTIQTAIAPLFCEEFTSRRNRHRDAAGGSSTNDRRDSLLHARQHAHALNHGGAID
jgi:hypothetical protein